MEYGEFVNRKETLTILGINRETIMIKYKYEKNGEIKVYRPLVIETDIRLVTYLNYKTKDSKRSCLFFLS